MHHERLSRGCCRRSLRVVDNAESCGADAVVRAREIDIRERGVTEYRASTEWQASRNRKKSREPLRNNLDAIGFFSVPSQRLGERQIHAENVEQP